MLTRTDWRGALAYLVAVWHFADTGACGVEIQASNPVIPRLVSPGATIRIVGLLHHMQIWPPAKVLIHPE